MTDEELRIGRIVFETSQSIAEGYRGQGNQADTPAQVEQRDACAAAASNTGYFILKAIGFTHEQILALKASA